MSIRREAIVIPSCVDLHRMFLDGPARLGVRSRLNISGEDVVFCYAGGLSRWQRVHDIIRVFGELAEHSDEYHFLFVTRETDRLAEMLAETNLLESTRCHQISCAQHEMRAYLSAADVAIIMRDNVATNNVASPIKIGEYLSCGLPVVSTVGIGDFGERLSRAGVCLLLDETRDLVPQIVAFIQRPLLADRRLLAPRVAAELFGIDAYATEYDVLYS